MKYLLVPDYRLRGWTDRLSNLEYFPTRQLMPLTPREYCFLAACDGLTEPDAKYAPQAEKFLRLGVIRAAEDGESLSPVQRFQFYENRLFRSVSLSVTGCCDFRCRHCFNAADLHARNIQPKTEELLSLIGRLDGCGVAHMRLTGGEPLLNRDFLRITQALHDRNILLDVINTNLYHLTPELLQELRAQRHDPEFYVSFDGVGFHDWLRGVPGAEARAVSGIRLLRENGFRVHAHCCVWRDSLPALRKTAETLAGLGVGALRVTPVEPSFTWMKNAPEQSLPIREWLEAVCGFLPWWYENRIDMALDIWSYWQSGRRNGKVRIVPDISHCGVPEERLPVCSDGYEMPYIDCDGRIMLCIAFSGGTKELGIDWGNVYTDDLHEMLRDGRFMQQCSCTVGQMKQQHAECQACEWKQHCGFGCRAEALAQCGSITGLDRRMCIFFKEGYYRRFLDIAAQYGLTPV